MVLRVTYYTILCGSIKALIPEILIYCSDNYVCAIQIPTTRLHTALTVEMVREGEKERKFWDLYMSSWSLDSGLLVFKANKLYLKWKTTLFIFEWLWWRVAVIGFLSQEPSPPSVGLACALSHSLAVHLSQVLPCTKHLWVFPLGFLELFLLVTQKDLSSQFTFLAIDRSSCVWFSSLTWGVPISSLSLLEMLN